MKSKASRGVYGVESPPSPRKKIFRHTPEKFLRMPLILRLPRPKFKNLKTGSN